jgi:hypothetical protein
MKTNVKRWSACLAILLLCPRLSYAQDARPSRNACDVQVLEDEELGHKVTELSEGCPAPFSGQLLNPKLAAELQQDVENKDREIQIAVSSTVAFWKNEMTFRLRLKDIDFEIQKKKDAVDIRSLEQQLDAATVWYKQPVVVAVGTAVVLAFLAAGTAALFDAVNQPD